VVLVAAGLLAAAGCAGSHRTGALAPDSVIAPSGGWPQPDQGRLTDKMCGLLSKGDTARVGQEYEPYSVPLLDLNALYCVNLRGGQFSMVIQPNAESAKLLFAAWRRSGEQNRKQNGVTAVVAEAVVPATDESLQVTTPMRDRFGGDQTVTARRGALVITVQLNDPESGPAAARLAGIILSRVPDLGRTDTGPTRTVRYELTGSGTLDHVQYRDPISGAWVDLDKVPLPWSVTLPFLVVNRENRPHFEVSGWGSAALITCTLSVDGKQRMSDVGGRRARCEADA
jgi:hypothetical protein